MTQKAYPLDDTEYYAEDVRLFHLGRTSGVFNITEDDLRVKANAESIQARDIIDTRLDENLCGLTVDGLLKIPTDGMNAQFLDFMKFIQDKLGEDEGGKLLLMIQNLEMRVAKLEKKQEIKYKIGKEPPTVSNCPSGYFYFQLEE